MRRHSLRPRLSVVLLGATFLLASCGVKGDLKRPKPIFDKNKSETTTPATPG